MKCYSCEKESVNGYYIDPVTGKTTKRFWCTDCYEWACTKTAQKKDYERYVERRQHGDR